jgi:serine/threonine protein kinase/formylglycine-generating enzyme required for sulfatase activity
LVEVRFAVSTEPCVNNESRESRLDRLIARFLEAEEAAEELDPAALLQQYPDLRDEFLSFLQHHQRLQHHFADKREPEPAPTLPHEVKRPGAAQPERSWQIEAGQSLGNCFLLRELGRGGMGIVFLGRHRRLDCLRAIKILPRDQITDTTIERFRREAQTAAGINHPNVITIHDASHEGEVHYIEMQYVEGETLRDVVNRHLAQGTDAPFSWVTAVNLLLPVLNGLAAVHARGLIHRDIKPSNIMVADKTPGMREPRVLLMDFGLVRDDTEARLTETGLVVGTPAFMSPEQARGQKVDTRTDLYALGATLYFLLAGRPPFEGPRSHVFWKAMSGKGPTSLRQLRPDIPVDLVHIVDRAMAPERDQRYSQADEIFEALSAVTTPAAARVSVAVPSSPSPPVSSPNTASSSPPIPSVETETVSSIGVSSDTFDLPGLHPAGPRLDAGLPSAPNFPVKGRADAFRPERPPEGRPALAASDTLTRIAPLRTLEVAEAEQGMMPALARWLPALGVAAVAVVIGLGLILIGGHPQPAKNKARPGSASATSRKDYPGMVYIPSGKVQLGASETRLRQHAMTLEDLKDNPDKVETFVGLCQREPLQQVTVGGYWIDRYEVTNAQYANFVRATGYPPPDNWKGPAPPPGSENRPVSGIRYRDADAYAKWAGQQLPTIAQWSRAFRGDDDRLYPWGDVWSSERANEYLNPGFDGTTSAVDATPRDVSPFGVFNLVGNVSEIVRERITEAGQTATVIKGSNAMSQGDVFGAAPVQLPLIPEDFTTEQIGFRCVIEER